jgi:hypothetical protein
MKVSQLSNSFWNSQVLGITKTGGGGGWDYK